MSPELQKVIEQLEILSKRSGSAQLEVKELVNQLKAIKDGSIAFNELANAALKLNVALGQSSYAEKYRNQLKGISAEALKAAEAQIFLNKQVANQPAKTGGGFAVKTNSEGIARIGAIGNTVPISGSIQSGDVRTMEAIDKAIKQMEADYGKLGETVNGVTVDVDQLTGKIITQAEVTREMTSASGQTYKQRFNVRTSSNPFTGETDSYTDAQQAFANQAGGLDRANQMLAQHGMELRNVTGFYKELNSNVSRFSVIGNDGISTAMGNMDQFGNATLHASRNAQTLLENVERNVAKVIEWSIATGLVYAAMNAVFQASGELKDIDETMADITIATGAAADELQRYYDAALNVANITGVDVTDTLEAQAKAYRAAASESDRFTAANKLLRDSMILSRLSGMGQAESLDTLVAALRQTGMSLLDGEKLLDKWVRTSKQAGVSVADLAQSFAITSDVADTVGISVDELNGLIAVLAEKTILSSTEIGNALRTMFSNITSDEAVSALGEVGIAVKDTNGEMRDWLEINQNIVDLMNSGALSDEQLNKLANALGGGSRRGPQILALWSNFGRVGQVSAQSLEANGDAADAMAIKLETLETALNTLHNTFNELVQALGYNGGFLDLVVDGIRLTTDLVKSLTTLAESFDKGAVSITGAMLAYLALKRVIGSVNWQGAMAAPPTRDAFGNITSTNAGPFASAANFLGRSPQGFQQTAIQGVTQAAPIIVGEIVRGLSSGDSAGQIGARVGSSVAGAIVGNMILPGAGGLIGAVIADSFVNQVQSKEDAIRALSLGESTTSQGQMELINKAFGGQLLDPLRLVSSKDRNKYSDEELLQLLTRGIKAGLPTGGAGASSPGVFNPIAQSKGFTQEETKLLQDMLQLMNPENAKLLLEQWEKYQQLKEQEAKAVQQVNETLTPQTAENIGHLIRGDQGKGLTASFDAQRNALISSSALTGDTEELNRTAEAMEKVKVATAAVAEAMTDANITTEDYIALGNTLLEASDAERDRIIQLASEINNLLDAREKLDLSTQRGRYFYEEYTKEIAKNREELGKTVDVTEQSAKVRDARERYLGFTEGPTDANGKTLTSGQVGFNKALEQARKAQDDYAKYLKIDPDALAASVTDPLVLSFADGFKTVEGLTTDFQKMFVDAMKETADKAGEAMSFSFKDLGDMSVGNFGAIQQKAKYYEKFLQQQYGPSGYSEDKQNVGLLFKDNQAKVINTTMTALTLALQDLTEVEKKQLEGVWNLPSGATAYVPITSLFYNQQGQGNDTASQIGEALTPAANTFNTSVAQFDAAVRNFMQIPGHEQRFYKDPRSVNKNGQEVPGYEQRFNEHGATTVEVQPQTVNVNIDGKNVAKATVSYESKELQNRMRTRGKLPSAY